MELAPISVEEERTHSEQPAAAWIYILQNLDAAMCCDIAHGPPYFGRVFILPGIPALRALGQAKGGWKRSRLI